MLRTALTIGLVVLPASVMSRDYCEGSFCFQKKARTSCLRPEMWGVLKQVAARVGRLEITSGCDGRHAKKSYHYSGRAVDFRPMDASVRTTLAVLRDMREVGGIGSYSNGLIHADVRPTTRVAWHGSGRTRVTVLREPFTRGPETRVAEAPAAETPAQETRAAPARSASARLAPARVASARVAQARVAHARINMGGMAMARTSVAYAQYAYYAHQARVAPIWR